MIHKTISLVIVSRALIISHCIIIRDNVGTIFPRTTRCASSYCQPTRGADIIYDDANDNAVFCSLSFSQWTSLCRSKMFSHCKKKVARKQLYYRDKRDTHTHARAKHKRLKHFILTWKHLQLSILSNRARYFLNGDRRQNKKVYKLSETLSFYPRLWILLYKTRNLLVFRT